MKYAEQQSQLVGEQLQTNDFQVILGGDCSILIGNAMALKQHGTYGLFFLDGHTDFITPDLSQTKAAAGMDLAIVTGHGHKKLTNCLDLSPYFREEHVFCVGNRELEPGYVAPILASDITYFDLDKLRSIGPAECAGQFLRMVNLHELDGFLVHLDVDVLDDTIMPAVDSRAPGGLSWKELGELLVPLLSSPKAAAIELTILDPTLDIDGTYAADFVRSFVQIVERAQAS